MSSQATASDRRPRPRQLALALDHPESFAREDFLSGGSNEAALTLVESWPDWPSRAVALIGPEGSGKTHLATIWATAAGARVVSANKIGAFGVPGLLAMPTAQLQAPDDAVLRGVMVKLAADRQLILDDSVISYLASRIERSFAAARAALVALDQEALRRSRPPSRALAAELFRDGG